MSGASKKRTSAANAYVAAKRRGDQCSEADWFTVADAYDAGLYHGVQSRESAKRVLSELQDSENDAAEKPA